MRAGVRSRVSALLVAALLASDLPAQPSIHSQDEVEAVYLFNFAKFVHWPAGSEHTTLTICVASQKSFADNLAKVVAGEEVDARSLAIRLIQRPEEEGACDVLFIGAEQKDRLESLLAGVAARPVLTVSDMPGFIDRGGMMQFLIVQNRVRFSVDLRPVGRSGLSLSSELLKVAVAVNGNAAGGGAP